MILDTTTKFCIVWSVHSLNAKAMIQTLTGMFSEQGPSQNIRCDCGRNFVSDLFQQYCNPLGINLSFSSDYHHSGYPAERAIRMVKGLMKCCTLAKQSWRLALLEYLSTPLDSNTPSPSELNGHHFNSMLPNVSNFSMRHSDKLVEQHDAQLQCDNKGHTLPELPVGSTVGYHNHLTNKYGIGIVTEHDARS